MCLTETWISQSKIDLLRVDGFKLAASFCRSHHAAGGTCILLEDKTEFIELKEINRMNIEFIFETCAIEIPKLELIVIVIYWPDHTRMPNIFFNSLTNLLQHVKTKYLRKHVIIGGDFNIDMLVTSMLRSDLIDLMKSYNFHQHIKEATRITETSSTCLDLIFTNFNVKKENISVHEYGLSDHRGTTIQIPTNHNNARTTWSVKKRIFNDQNINNFILELNKVDFHKLMTREKTLNENYMAFQSILTSILNKTIPLKNVKIKLNSKKKTWLTKGIKQSCKNKRLLKLLVNKTDNKILNNAYKHYERLLKKIVKTSKRIQNIKKIKNSDNIIKSTWQLIKEQTNKITKIDRVNIKLTEQNKIIDNPLSIANIFNDFFLNVANSDPSLPAPKGKPVIEPSENSMYLKPVTIPEVIKIIRELKNKKSFGHDELPPILIKKSVETLAPILSFLINQSFADGTVPDLLKLSIIKPIYKKGNKSNCTNYRPIALLPTFAKIFETAMANRLYSFCEQFNIFSKSQYGFRKNRSTSLAVFKYITDILNIINNKKYAIGVLLDMSKAYDRVLYDILLKKLYGIGVRGIVHKWFDSYLSNRYQLVEIEHYDGKTGVINKVRSEKAHVTKSIPQGSVLGCILFLLYINDLPKQINHSSTVFADDISIVIPCQNATDLNVLLQTTFDTLINWLNEHNLQINYSKTKLLQFKPHQKRPLEINYSYLSNKIECAKTYPLLGINIDSNINWKDHIANISTKLSRFTYALHELKKYTDVKTALSAYYAYAHAWLQYGIVVWGNSTNVPNLFLLQKKCVRIIANVDNMTSCKPYFKQYKILTLTSIYILEISNFVKKNLHMFPKYSRPNNLRPKSYLSCPQTKLKMVDCGPFTMATKIYNNLPKNLQEMEDVTKFKKLLKDYLTDKCYYVLQEFFEDKTY